MHLRRLSTAIDDKIFLADRPAVEPAFKPLAREGREISELAYDHIGLAGKLPIEPDAIRSNRTRG